MRHALSLTLDAAERATTARTSWQQAVVSHGTIDADRHRLFERVIVGLGRGNRPVASPPEMRALSLQATGDNAEIGHTHPTVDLRVWRGWRQRTHGFVRHDRSAALRTRRYCRFVARLVLINGAPGSGKSTIAAALAQDNPM